MGLSNRRISQKKEILLNISVPGILLECLFWICSSELHDFGQLADRTSVKN